MRAAIFGLACLSAAGCIRAAGSVAEPTAIERQLLGAYQQLDRELVWVSSVRGADGGLPDGSSGDVEDLETRALRMRLLQRFNEDDLARLADWRCVAEGRAARLVAVPCERVREEARWARIRDRVLTEENGARDVIIEWAASEAARREGRPQADEDLIARMRAAYADLMRAAADPDHLVETPQGDLQPASQWSP